MLESCQGTSYWGDSGDPSSSAFLSNYTLKRMLNNSMIWSQKLSPALGL